MPATLVAAPAAPAPEPEKHSFLQSLAYHLLPGLAPLAFMLLLAPPVKAWGLPPVMAVIFGALLGVLPLQLGILYYQGWQRNGRLSLQGIVLLREPVPALHLILLVVGLFLYSGLIVTFLGGRLDGLLLPLFDWIPEGVRVSKEGLGSPSLGTAVLTGATGLLFIAFLAPFVEELYFRGFLLPRIPAAGTWSPLVNAALFACYHLWSPWMIPSRILMVAPLAYAVHKKRSIWISVVTHCLLNTVDVISWIPFLLLK